MPKPNHWSKEKCLKWLVAFRPPPRDEDADGADVEDADYDQRRGEKEDREAAAKDLDYETEALTWVHQCTTVLALQAAPVHHSAGAAGGSSRRNHLPANRTQSGHLDGSLWSTTISEQHAQVYGAPTTELGCLSRSCCMHAQPQAHPHELKTAANTPP